jgi:hypothetical protein
MGSHFLLIIPCAKWIYDALTDKQMYHGLGSISGQSMWDLREIE